MSRRLLGWSVAGTHGALVGDVHLPDDPGPAPAILVRTPYGREGFAGRGAWWARRGWVFVVQDVAGRYDSEGPWKPYAHELGDGARTVDAVRAATWCDGRVVVAGASYSAFCAWQAAVARPGTVAAVVSEVPALGPPRTTRESGGVPRLGDHVAWWLRHGDARISRSDAAIAAALGDGSALLPGAAATLPDRLGVHAPGFADALATPTGPGSLDLAALGRLPMPTLHSAGLFDLFLADAHELWAAAGSAVDPRPAADLVVGPWGHGLDGPERHGRTLEWLNAHVGGPAGDAPGDLLDGPWSADGGDAGVRRHRLPLGATSWRTTLGVADATPTTLTLAADGLLVGELGAEAPSPRAAHSPASRDRPAPPAPAWIVHDPTDPVRSSPPATDRRRVGGPSDGIQRWRTIPFPDGGEVDGRARLIAVAAAEPRHADWIAHLELHDADGAAVSLARSTATVAVSPAALELDFPPVAAVIPPGGAIGLTLSGADHPDLLVHPRTAADRLTTTDRRPGRQRLLDDPDHPARLLLPLLPDPGPR